MKTAIVHAYKTPVLFAAIFFCVLFSFTKPVEVKAREYSGNNVKASMFTEDESVTITGNTTIDIDRDVHINQLVGSGYFSIKVIGDGTLTVNEIRLNSIDVILEGGKIQMDNGRGSSFRNLTVKGGMIEASAWGDNVIYVEDSVEITGGSVKVTSEELCGITAKNITISGGSIDATGKTIGLYASPGVIGITGDNTVIKAKTTDNTRAGLQANGGITIDSPLVVATPAGGGISSDGTFIATVAGGTKKSTEVEIKRGYSITVAGDGHGTGTATPARASGGATITLSATPDEGYEFYKWTTEDDIQFADEESADTQFDMINRDVTVTANFKPEPPAEKCTITFDKNGGLGTMNPQQVNKGAATKLRKNTFTRDVYEFKNWNTKSDGSGTSYADEGNITVEKDTTLYAQWKKDKDKDDDDDDDDSHEESGLSTPSQPSWTPEMATATIAAQKAADQQQAVAQLKDASAKLTALASMTSAQKATYSKTGLDLEMTKVSIIDANTAKLLVANNKIPYNVKIMFGQSEITITIPAGFNFKPFIKADGTINIHEVLWSIISGKTNKR